jgi:hypothetical protein
MLRLLSWLIVTAAGGAQGATKDAVDTWGDLFGYSVNGGLDMDGDGVPDYVISAPIEREGGVIRVYSGKDGFLRQIIVGAGGDAVRLIQDIDDDLTYDLIVSDGVYVRAFSGFNPATFVESGATRERLVWEGPGDRHSLEEAGNRLIGCEVLRDTNLDGVQDIAITVIPREDLGLELLPLTPMWASPPPMMEGDVGREPPEGLARVLSGKDGSTLTEVPCVGPHGCIAGLDDVNGDERGDFAVVSAGGRINVHSGADAALLYSVPREAGLDPWRVSLLLEAVDTNQDSIAEWVYAYRSDWHGGHDLTIVSGSDGEVLGLMTFPEEVVSALALPDRDSDGQLDCLVSFGFAGGRVQVVSELDGWGTREIRGSRDDLWLGYSMANVGDTDGDGVDDFLFGACNPFTIHAAGYAELRSGATWELIREHSAQATYPVPTMSESRK